MARAKDFPRLDPFSVSDIDATHTWRLPSPPLGMGAWNDMDATRTELSAHSPAGSGLNAGGADSINPKDIPALMRDTGVRARAATRHVALASPERKNAALRAMAARIRERATAILALNADDVVEAKAK